MPPPAIDRIHQCRARKCHRAITVTINAVFDDNSKMLVTTQVCCLRGTQMTQRFVPARLRPTIAIQVSQQTLTRVDVHRSTKSRL